MLLCFAAAGAQAQAPYQPVVGQPGKDVIWVPTPDPVVNRMLRAAEVTPSDVVVDLGSGDGRIVIGAAKLGARAVGVEYNPDLVALARRAARQAGVADRARFVHGDLFAYDYSKATVVALYLLPPLLERLLPGILALAPGTRIVSYEFPLADWEPDEVTELYGSHSVYLWIVPAAVSGVWQVDADGKRYEIVFEQKFQRISATVELGKSKVGLRDVRVRGARIWFTLVDDDGARREFEGKVRGKQIAGTMRLGNGRAVPFSARW